jgi:prepilin-type N-terminal cleavage/methylation domain-containing protein
MTARSDRRGFSLLELMVVVAILGLVAGVVVASFSGGLRVWESARVLTHVEQEVYFGVENVRRDIANTFAFHDIKFAGSEREVSFPAVFEVPGEDGEPELRIGTVKYQYSGDDRTLMRLAWPYPGVEDSADREIIAEGVESVRFRYRGGPDSASGSEWIGTWQHPTNFPAAVNIELKLSEMGPALAIDRDIPLVEGLWHDDS